MSRIGKQPITIPSGVTVFQENGVIRVEGSKGMVSRAFRDTVVSIHIDEGLITLAPVRKSSLEARALWGSYAAHLKNMIRGVTEGFSKKLEIEGIGYRAQMQGPTLVLSLGYSHPVLVQPKEGIQFSVEKNTITVSGIDKEKVGEAASYIRSLRKPEPYKGKGIRYKGEVIRRKAGKKAATTSA